MVIVVELSNCDFNLKKRKLCYSFILSFSFILFTYYCYFALTIPLTIIIFSEGYESLLRARGEGTSISAAQGTGENIFSGGIDAATVALESAKPSTDEYDIFAEDDENTTSNPSSNEDNLASRPYSDGVGQPLPNTSDTHTESKLFFLFFVLFLCYCVFKCVKDCTYHFTRFLSLLGFFWVAGEALQSDYVFDESSGYTSLFPSMMHLNFFM